MPAPGAEHAEVSEQSPETTQPPASEGPSPAPAPAPPSVEQKVEQKVEPAAPPPSEAAPAEPAGGESAATEPGVSDAPASGEQAGVKKKRRRRRRKKSDTPEGQPRPSKPREAGANRARSGNKRRGSGDRPQQHHALTAIRSLSSMAEGLLQVEGIDVLSRPRFMDIEVRIPLDRRDASKSASQVLERILQRVKEVRDNDRALVPGSVYSYFSESAQGEECRPKELREVFDGYTSTGRPNFTDFVTMAIERKQDGIDELLGGEDHVLTHVTMGRVLRTAQLAEFGKSSPVFQILGQVDAGLYSVMNSSTKAAFSFQLLRGATLEGLPRLRVHAVGAADLMDLADPSIANTLSRFQRRLDQEALRLAGKLAQTEEVDEEEFVLPMLQDLAKQLAGQARRKSRRTKHAEERSEDRERPTDKAFGDARSASDDHLLWDDRENTAVVLGPRGRVHVFTPEAKHVTSLVMQGSAINKRRQQRQWRDAEPEERGEFRMAVRKMVGSAEAQAAVEAAPQPEPAAQPTPAPVEQPEAQPPTPATPPPESSEKPGPSGSDA